MIVRTAAVLSLLLAGADRVVAQEPVTATYVVRLGVDTTAIERWTRSPDSLHVVAVTRSPRTTVRRYVVRFDSAGRVLNVSTGAAGAEPVAMAGAVPIAGGTYAPYAVAVWQAMRDGAAESVVAMRAGSATRPVSVRRSAPQEYTLPNQFDAMLTVRLDGDGGVTGIDAGGGATVERVAPFDFEAMTREFALRDERGTGLGPLSPRDTVRATIDGANVLIDYSRPSARGRTVLGGLVPYGAVWRTGANDATQLITDAPLRIGDVEVAPGRYSLFTLPREDGWDLIINRRVGMSGLEHDPAQDVGRVSMRQAENPTHTEQFTIRLDPAGTGAWLRILWGNAAVSVPVRRQ